jgi:hypothetical protein
MERMIGLLRTSGHKAGVDGGMATNREEDE